MTSVSGWGRVLDQPCQLNGEYWTNRVIDLSHTVGHHLTKDKAKDQYKAWRFTEKGFQEMTVPSGFIPGSVSGENLLSYTSAGDIKLTGKDGQEIDLMALFEEGAAVIHTLTESGFLGIEITRHAGILFTNSREQQGDGTLSALLLLNRQVLSQLSQGLFTRATDHNGSLFHLFAPDLQGVGNIGQRNLWMGFQVGEQALTHCL